MVATEVDSNLAGLILDAGLYDIKAASNPKTIANIKNEVGDDLTPEQIKQRSAPIRRLLSSGNIKISQKISSGKFI